MNDFDENENTEIEIETGTGPIQSSESCGKLYMALGKANLEITDPIKDTENSFFKSSYADLATVIRSVRRKLASQGLSIIQMPYSKDFGTMEVNTKQGKKTWGVCRVFVSTRLCHESGEWIQSTISCQAKGENIAQSLGSVATYLRRYALAAMVCIAQADNEGEEEEVVDLDEPIDEKQIAYLESLLLETKSDKTNFLKWVGVSSLDEIGVSHLDRILRPLQQKMKALEESKPKEE